MVSAPQHVLGAKMEQALLDVAAQTPSLVGDCSIHVKFRQERVDVWATPRLGGPRPSRPTVVSSGALVFDLSTAIRVHGRMTAVHVLPLRSEPRLIAAIHVGRKREPKWVERLLYEAMTGPEGFGAKDVESTGFWHAALADLRVAAQDGGAMLHCLTAPQLAVVSDRLRAAGRRVGVDVFDGFGSADPAVVRTAVLATRDDTPADWVWAGIAWRRVQLVAAGLGLSTSCVGTLLDTGDTRWGIQEALSSTDWPQIVLRFGPSASFQQTLNQFGTAFVG